MMRCVFLLVLLPIHLRERALTIASFFFHFLSLINHRINLYGYNPLNCPFSMACTLPYRNPPDLLRIAGIWGNSTDDNWLINPLFCDLSTQPASFQLFGRRFFNGSLPEYYVSLILLRLINYWHTWPTVIRILTFYPMLPTFFWALGHT